MKFRAYIAAKRRFQEADLLGAPTSGGSSPSSDGGAPQADLSPKTPSTGSDRPHPSSTEQGREVSQSNEQMRKALALAVQLGKTLAGLPHPWVKQFHAFKEPLRALVSRLQGVT